MGDGLKDELKKAEREFAVLEDAAAAQFPGVLDVVELVDQAEHDDSAEAARWTATSYFVYFTNDNTSGS